MPRGTIIRLLLLTVVLGGLLLAAHLTGLTDHFSKAGLRAAVDQAGGWGILLFLGAFCLDSLMHTPGLIFVAVAVAAFGFALGTTLAVVGASLSMLCSFAIVRAIGGKALAAIKQPLLRKLLA